MVATAAVDRSYWVSSSVLSEHCHAVTDKLSTMHISFRPATELCVGDKNPNAVMLHNAKMMVTLCNLVTVSCNLYHVYSQHPTRYEI
ncbi:hypothetical protein J6590_056089 [Homalodisca vitripennis]|nr:hypothetical protein J6590_056089 [Homalodisca vitripennis]